MNKAMRVALLAGGLALFASAATVAQDQARAELRDPEGNAVGTVTLTQGPYGTIVRARFTNMAPGSHAFHVHATGRCEPPDFKSAGGHYNPEGFNHGYMDGDGMHAGDLPNIHVPPSGTLEVEVFAPRVNLDAMLFDADGAAVVVHEGPDDYASDPAGAAGARIACGVIEPAG